MSRYLQMISVELSQTLCAAALAQDDHAFVAMADIYWHYCPKIRTDGIGKVRLCFHESESRAGGLETLIDVVSHHNWLDPVVFKRSRTERRQIATDVIHYALKRVCKHFGWDSRACDVAYDRVIENGYKIFAPWKKPVRQRDRAVSAHLWWRYEEDITVGLELKGVVRRNVVLTVLRPGMDRLLPVLGNLEWQDRDTVRLRLKNKRDFWLYDVAEDKAEFIYGPAHDGDPKGEYDLGRMYLEGHIVSKDPAAALHWLGLSAAHGFGRAKRLLEQLAG